MGLKLFSDSPGASTAPPNPNPKKFHIKSGTEHGSEKHPYSVLQVQYPGCTTYNGNKIMVYIGTLDQFFGKKELDPHFEERSNLIARFPSTDEGMEDAIAFAEMKSKQDELAVS